MKWGGAAVTMLLVVVWIATLWSWPFVGIPGTWRLRAERGALVLERPFAGVNMWPLEIDHSCTFLKPCCVGYTTTMFGGGWHRARDSVWLPHFRAERIGGRWWIDDFFLPLWIPIFAFGGAGLLAWRLDTLARRRARVGFCPKCNYDRTGLMAGAKCPECGSTAA